MASTEPILADAPFKIVIYDSFWQACSKLNPGALFLLAKILCDEKEAQEYQRITKRRIEQDQCSAYYIAALAYSFADQNKQKEISDFVTEKELDSGQCKSFHDLGIPLSLTPEHSNVDAKLLYEQCKKSNKSKKRPHFQPVAQNLSAETPNGAAASLKASGNKIYGDGDVYFDVDEEEDLSADDKYLIAPGDESPSFETMFTLLNKAKEFVEDNPVPFIIVSMAVAFGITVALGGAPIVTTLAVAGAAIAISIGCRLYGQCFFGNRGYKNESEESYVSPLLFGSSSPRPFGGWD